MKPDSMWPIHSSDLHEVIANMKAKSVASPPGTGNANSPVAKVDSPQEKKSVTFTKLKDVYVLKFPEDGTRLIAHRHKVGHNEVPPRQPSRLASVPSVRK